jgi:bud emergence protein 1
VSLFRYFDRITTPLNFMHRYKSNRASMLNAGPRHPMSPSFHAPQPSPIVRHQTFYAIVQYDFVAERPDELDAKAGEPISVVAQSNREWFVAKPIGRLGGPGLIPVAFVEIRDPSSGRRMDDDEVNRLMDKGDLPSVEQWKKATMDYKASSIPLGVLDPPPGQVVNSPYAPKSPPIQQSHYQQQPPDPSYYGDPTPPQHEEPPQADDFPDVLPEGTVLEAGIPSFHYEGNEYWFRLDVFYQPDPSPRGSLPPLRQLMLFRNYDDFYEFQINLLDTFPTEAGRNADGTPMDEADEAESTRILPYMPGPVDYVDDIVTSHRRNELDIYLKQLCGLGAPEIQAGYILRCSLVRSFFSPKPGDTMLDVPPEEAKKRRSGLSSTLVDSPRGGEEPKLGDGSGSKNSLDQRLSDQMRALNVDPHDRSSSSDYGQPASPVDQADSRTQSLRKSGRTDSPAGGDGRDSFPSPFSPINGPGPQSSGFYPSIPPARDYKYTQSQEPAPPPPQPQSNNRPPSPQRQNSNAPFLKIKIFHQSSDDLIAIRVHPRITFNQLLGKVRERLGSNVNSLRYRPDSYSGDKSFKGIEGDAALREWVETTDKLVLYAD